MNPRAAGRRKLIGKGQTCRQTDRQTGRQYKVLLLFFSSQKHSTVEGDSIILVINEARNEGPCTEFILLP